MPRTPPLDPTDTPESPPEVWVVGLGSVLAGDDAFGPTVVRVLDALWKVPEGVGLLDAGTPGMDLATHIRGCRALIVIDTVVHTSAPGTQILRRRGDLLKRGLLPRVNPHAPGLLETLLTLDLHGEAPEEVLLVAVVPEQVDVGIGMSDVVNAAVPKAVESVVEELERLGKAGHPRAQPESPDLWWSRTPGLSFLLALSEAAPPEAMSRRPDA